MELVKETIHGSTTTLGESNTVIMGEGDIHSDIPWWVHWISTAVLSLTFLVGLPLNGATVLIFCRRKKLRHLVNFVLLLDCLSHIVLCLFCIPIHLVSVWSGSSLADLSTGNSFGMVSAQQLIGNFVNLYSTFLTVSIAILRYRRLCWKKKDKFSTVNALKWSVCSGIIAVSVIFAQFYALMLPEGEKAVDIIYLVKISLILLAVATVFFCYIRVSQRVWANTANQEKTMDPAKLKKSRSVHMKATIHSCVQIILVVTTVTPHLYLQVMEMMSAPLTGSQESQTVPMGGMEEPLISASQQQVNAHHHLQPEQSGEAGWLPDSDLSFSRHPAHHESFSETTGGEPGFVRLFEIFTHNVTTAEENTKEPSHSVPVGFAAQLSAFGASQVAKLIAITVNYALLALGTPCAYIASCHRFREQFTSILFSHGANSPQNSTCHHHQHGHHQNSSPGHKPHHRDRYYQRSTTGGTHDACFSSPLTRADKTSMTTLQHHSSMSRSGGIGHPSTRNGSSARESVSISISANTSNSRSSFSHSFKSRSSMRKSSVCGSSMKRRKSSSAGASGVSKGLLGVSIADSVFMESDSALILEPESNVSSSTGNLKRCTPSPSPTGGDEVSARGSSGELLKKSGSPSHFPLTAVTTITNSSNLHTYLHNYGEYDCNADLGQLV